MALRSSAGLLSPGHGVLAVRASTRTLAGDANWSGEFDVSDPISVLGYLFLGKPEQVKCIDAADKDDSGDVDLSDAIALLNYIFLSGSNPKSPFPECGVDETPDKDPITGEPNFDMGCAKGCEAP